MFPGLISIIETIYPSLPEKGLYNQIEVAFTQALYLYNI